jgi:amino acid adenylation domain-containing protein
VTFIDIIERWAEIRPEATALTALQPGGGAGSITYRALLHKVRGLAADIETRVAPGERVLVMEPNGIGFMLGYLACIAAGTIAVPVPVPRPQRDNERLKLIIGDCAPSAAIAGSMGMASSYADALGEEARSLLWLCVDQAGSRAAARARHVAPDTIAMLQYTSGSTASPKGVKLTHGNLLHNQTMMDASFGLDDRDTVLGWLPLFHDMGLIGMALHPIYKGVHGILLSPESFIARPLSWLRAISVHGATVSGAPNFAYELCARLVRESDRRGLDLSRWRIAFSGSERVRPQTLLRFEQAFAGCGFRKTSFLPCYGMAEATLMISGRLSGSANPPLVKQVNAQALEKSRRIVDARDDSDAIGVAGVGSALPGEMIVIVEPDGHRRLADREIGEVWVASPSVSPGYWGRAEHAHVRPPWDAGRDYLRTGDLGFIDDGELFITGRLKDLLIIRGRNIFPEDVEAVVERCLAGSVSGRIAAFSVEADNEERLVVAFESTLKRELAISVLAGEARTVLGQRFEVELHALVAVKRGGLPLTSSGKLRRNYIRELWLEQRLPVLAQAFVGGPAGGINRQPARAALARATREEARSLLRKALIEEIRGLGGMEHLSDQALGSSSLPGLGLGSLQIIHLIHHIDDFCGVRLALADGFEAASLDALVDVLIARVEDAAQGTDAVHTREASAVTAAPLSLGQQGIWFAQELSPRSSAWQIARAAEAFPAIDVNAMNKALAHLVCCHPALRLALDTVRDGETPVQRLASDVRIEARLLSCGSPSDRDLVLREEARKPFNLSVAPLLRVSILRAPGCHDLLALVAHHIICDLWSLSVLIDDLFRFYQEALAGGLQAPASGGPTFLDHVLEEGSRTSTDGWERRMSFWKHRLGDAGNWMRSITAAAGEEAPFHAEIRRVRRETMQKLRRLAGRHDMSLQMVLFAAFQLAVAVLDERDGVLACIVTNGRERADRRRMVGYFSNLLLFLVRIDRRNSAGQWLRAIRRQMLDAYANELPYEQVIRGCANLHAHERPVKYAFVMQDEGVANSPGFVPFSLGQAGGRWKSGNMELASVEFEEEHAQFPLALYAGVDQDGLLCCYKGSGPLLTPGQTRAVAHLVERVFEWLASADADDRRLSELQWLDADQRRLFEKQADAARHDSYLQPQHLLDQFEKQCVRTPDRIALEFEDASVTYAHLQARVVRMASYLRSRGVGRETIVGVCMHRSLDLVVAIYGVLKAGGAYLPLDPEHPAGYLKTLASEAGLRYIVSGGMAGRGALTGEPEREGFSRTRFAADLPEVEIIDVEAGMRWGASDQECAPPLPDQLAYVIFTSGSTGVPKAAMNTHAGIVNRLLWMQDRYKLDESDVLVQKTPFTFDVSVWELFWPLMVGARLVIAQPRMHKDPGYLADLLAGRMVTLAHFVPSMLRVFLLEERCVSCRALHTVICSGEALPTRLVRQLAARLPLRIENLYGPTEASVDVTYYHCDENWPGAVQPIGRAIANTRLHVLDAALQALPVDITGTLFISSAGLARGYLANPSLTAERFLPDPFGHAARMYNTGDLGRFRQPDLIEFCGRADRQIKLRGLRIELSEIEAVLERHESILAAAVMARDGSAAAALRYVDREPAEPQWGIIRDHRKFLHGELVTADAADLPSRLVAYCVLNPGAALDVESIQQWVRARLPEQSVPAAVIFLDQMPVNANGKLDKARLPEPDSARPLLRSDYCAPRNARERSLVDAWERVMDVRGIGVRDNFFALGGDSIRALRLISHAAHAGIVFDLATLFAHPTIEQLADYAATAESVPYTTVERFSLLSIEDRRKVPEGVVDAYPLAAVQAGLIFHDEAAGGSEVYKDVFAYRVRARFDEAAFRASVATLLDRHETLRSSIDLLNFSVPVQLVHPDSSASVEVIRMDAAGGSPDAGAFVAQQRSQAFDWTRPPFIRFAIGLHPPEEFELFVIFHDLLLDGWSASQLVSELLLIYDRLLDGNGPVSAPALRVRFADYVAGELEAGRSAEARAFFATYLADAPEHRFPISESAGDHDAAAVSRFAVLDVPISLATSEQLKKVARACGVGIKQVLLAAHVAVLSQVFGERDILTGLESNGRLETEDGEMVIGMHLNTLPFRIRCAAGRWRDLIREVYQTEQRLTSVRRYPYANLQRMLGTGNLVDTVFNYVHFHGFRRLLQLRHLEVKEARGYGASHFKYRSEFSTDPFSGRIHHCLECDTRSIPADLMQEIGRYFIQVLDAIATDVDARYDGKSLAQDWPPSVAGNETQTAEIWLRPWERRLEQDGDRIALVRGRHRFSFTSVQRRAQAWARVLVRRGVGPECCVGVLVRDPIEYSLAILAIQLAGGAYVPLNLRHPAERNRNILIAGGIAWVIVDDIAAIGGTISSVEMISPNALDAHAKACEPLPAAGASDPDQLSYVIYTSGSTGSPKGVMVSLANLWFSLMSRLEYYARPEPAVFLMVPPFAFDSSVAVFFWSLAGGHRLVFPETDVSDLLSVLRTIREEEVTHVLCTPSYYGALLAEAGDSDLQSLDTVIMAGESLSRQLVLEHRAMLPRVAMFNEYGPTEGTVWSSVHRCEDDAEHVPVGKPRGYTSARILDRRRLAAAPGQMGELVIGGAGVARGYMNAPAATAAAFVPDPAASVPGSRAYATGDCARAGAGGAICLLGRNDRQVKINGYRVELDEIEHAMRRFPAVEACAAVCGAPAGGPAQITAYVVGRDGRVPEFESLETILPGYMVPSRFLPLGALPLNANGKVDYQCLRDRGEQLSEEWQAQRIIDEVERMTEEDVISALARASASPRENLTHGSIG